MSVIPVSDYKALFESAPSLYMVLSPAFIIVSVSDAYLRATKTQRDIEGRPLFEVFPDNPDDPAADGVRNLKASLERVLSQRMPHTMDIQKYDIRKPDSEGGGFEERHWSCMNTPVFDKKGKIAYIIHKAEDVTEILKLQEAGDEQIRINKSLRNLLVERTKMISERERLIEKLTKSNQDLERFAYTASHDLRSPLRAIDNLSQIIQSDLGEALAGESARHLDLLRQRVKRMEKLLDDILAYARLDNILEQGEGGSLSLKVMIDEIMDLLAAPRDVEITLGPGVEAISMPRIPLQQVLRNLIDNAIKHNDKTICTIAIDVADNKDRYIFSVRDNGPGIAPQYHQKIFEMFQTLRPRDSVEGSGMGLAFVKQILSHYNSVISVESNPDEGAVFRFDWPKTIPTAQKKAGP